ncbi:MAG: ATP-binding protein [Elusimicrobiota bacterium]
MKLFHKFFIAILLASIIPLVIYSLIILTTTGTTLKRVINRNNINKLENIVRDVNKYLSEVEEELSIARYIDRSPGMAAAEKSRLIMNKLSGNKILTGIYLLDVNRKIETGLSKEEGKAAELDRKLVDKASRTGRVELGGILQNASGKPYFDIVYPEVKDPAEYLYFRARLDVILNRINTYLKQEGGAASKEVILSDEYGNTLSSLKGSGKGGQDFYRDNSARAKDTVFEEKGRINIYSSTAGPGWLVVYTETAGTAYAPVRALWIGSLLLIIISAGLAFFGAFTLAANLTKPVKNLISGIETVASGNLDYKVPEVSKDELSKLVSIFNSMTVKLKNLQEGIKKAERLSAIGQMANILGHEIRNPLSAIRNSAYLIKTELLKAGSIDPKFQKRLDIIEAEIKSTDKIINDMLDFSRTRQPVLSRQDLNQLLRNIIEEDQMPSHIRTVFELGEISHASIDEEEMKQVIRNLVNNAVHSMAEIKEGTLTITTGRSTVQTAGKTRNAVYFEIRDTGKGIRRTELASVFDPFYSTKSHGTGLGLAVVKRVVEERHKGSVAVRSEEGRGTSFFVKLPVD